MEKQSLIKMRRLSHLLIYIILGLLTISILLPVAWVFMASIRENSEFYGSPWQLPAGFHWQNFADAWNKANMGSYFMNSVFVTVLAIVLILVIALPAAYSLSRFRFKSRAVWSTLCKAGLFNS